MLFLGWGCSLAAARDTVRPIPGLIRGSSVPRSVHQERNRRTALLYAVRVCVFGSPPTPSRDRSERTASKGDCRPDVLSWPWEHCASTGRLGLGESAAGPMLC